MGHPGGGDEWVKCLVLHDQDAWHGEHLAVTASCHYGTSNEDGTGVRFCEASLSEAQAALTALGDGWCFQRRCSQKYWHGSRRTNCSTAAVMRSVRARTASWWLAYSSG